MLSSLFVCFHALSIGDSNELCLSSTCYRIIDEVVIGWTEHNASPCCTVSLWKFCLFDWQQTHTDSHSGKKILSGKLNWKRRTKESGKSKVKIPFYIFLFVKPFHHIYRQFPSSGCSERHEDDESIKWTSQKVCSFQRLGLCPIPWVRLSVNEHLKRWKFMYRIKGSHI